MFDSVFVPAPVGDPLADPYVDDVLDEAVDGTWDRVFGEVGPDGLGGEDLAAAPWSELPPSGLLLDMLAARPRSRCSDWEAVEAVAACERIIARATAVQADAVARLADLRGDRDSGYRSTTDEVAAALRLSTVAAGNRVALAVDLAGRLPAARAALYAGEITAAKARAVWEATIPLDADAARRVEAHVLRRAPDQTPAQLRACLRRAVLKADPDGARRRHTQRKTERRVERDVLDDGMGSLWAYLTGVEACAVYTRLTDAARAMKTPGDDRGVDERRADALVALCLGRDPLARNPTTRPTGAPDTGTGSPGNAPGRRSTNGPDDTGGAAGPPGTAGAPGTPGTASAGGPVGAGAAGAGAAGPGGTGSAGLGIAVQVGVTVWMGTLLGLDDEPGELAGYGPIPADMARHLAADGTWRRLLTDPATGALLDYGRGTYRPPANLAHYVRARDVTCRFPTCQQPAWRGDLDHVIPWPNGPTADHNLGPLCRRHHQLKQHPDWRVTRNADGAWTWTTPTGHTYTTPTETHSPINKPNNDPPNGHDPPDEYGPGHDRK